MLKDLVDSTPDDLPPIEVTSNLLQLDLPAEACFYKGETKQLSMRGGVDGPLIRANRSRLRDWLATNIDIQWNRKVTRIEETEDAVKVVFEDGSIATGDVLVGADGVNSIGMYENSILSQTFVSNLNKQYAPTSSALKTS